MVTRAVHLELVDDLSAKEYLLSFRRVAARRGTPELVVTDNAPQFKVAHDTMDLAWKDVVHADEVLSYASSNAIHWQLIFEVSPWMGGFYE